MITRFKHMLGIEGAKVKIIVDEHFDPTLGVVKGDVELVSLKPVTVNHILIKVEERYERGRQKRKLIDKYLLAEREIDVKLVLAPDTPVKVPFEINFEKIGSPVDDFANKGLFNSALAWTAKKLKNVTSRYLLTAEALVEGTRLNPFDTVEILRE